MVDWRWGYKPQAYPQSIGFAVQSTKVVTMPKRPDKIISWYPARQCWRKKYKGNTYYLAKGGICKDENDLAGYETALGEWFDIRRRLEATPEVQPKQPALDIKLPRKLVAVASMATDYSALPDELPHASIAVLDNAPVNALIEAYLLGVQQLAASGKRSIATYKEAKDKLGDFQGYARKYQRTTIDEIDAHLLKCYRDTQLALVDKGKVSAFTAKKRLAAVKRFLEWCYRNEYIDRLPRNIDRTFAQVELPDPTPHPFSKSEVQELWKAALETRNNRGHAYRNALYVALGLNCGYRSGDIATLRRSHIKEENGVWYIDRQREKTGSPQHHKLWNVTKVLLQTEMTKTGDLLLVDEFGGPLVKEALDKAKQDCVQQAFKRLARRMEWKGANKGHSCLRDTGADTLKKHFAESWQSIVPQYLGHTPTGMHRHYAKEHYDLLNSALDWMEGHFDLKL